MLKHTLSELKEALVCLEPGRATLPYPFQPHPPEGSFRGQVQMDFERCIGCGACANACPARLIQVSDQGDRREITFELGRCTYCARCRDVCPQGALSLSGRFETATPTTGDLRIRVRLHLVRCRVCGDVVGTRRSLVLVREALAKMDGLAPEAADRLDLCLRCKRQLALRTPALLEEVAP